MNLPPKWFMFIAAMCLALCLNPNSARSVGGDVEAPSLVLARVDVKNLTSDMDLPIFAFLRDGSGCAYALVVTKQAALIKAKVVYQVLDSGYRSDSYVLVAHREEFDELNKMPLGAPVYDDGKQRIYRATTSSAEAITRLGYLTKRLPARSISINITTSAHRPALSFRRTRAADPVIADMISNVRRADVTNYLARLSGVISIDDTTPYYVRTRFTSSGEQLRRAADYVYGKLQSYGLNVSTQSWSAEGGTYSNINVIAELPGQVHTGEIVIVCAHLDSIASRNYPDPSMTLAPGADDNGSGSVGVLVCASIMSYFNFDRTIRFAFFTGEEQGLYGSAAYAAACHDAGQNVVAVFNMDMISYHTAGQPHTLCLHIRSEGVPGHDADLAIAEVFTNVVSDYSLSSDLTPGIFADDEWASDHSSFWDNGYPALLAIEDDLSDFNPYYHTTNDSLSNIDADFCTAYIKAALGTAATLAEKSADSCRYQISPSSTNVSALGATGDVVVTAWTNCEWTASSTVDWVSITNGSSGSGTGTVQYVVSSNSTPSVRIGSILLPNDIFEIVQDAASIPEPHILTQPQTQTAIIGRIAYFSVIAGGEEPLYYQWQKDGTNISLATNSSYEIMHVSPTDAGIYCVVVTNNYGQTTSSNATLRVTEVTMTWWVLLANRNIPPSFPYWRNQYYPVEHLAL